MRGLHSPHWIAATDVVRVASTTDFTAEFLVLPITNPDHVALSAQVVIEQTIAGGDDDIDLVVPDVVSNDEGVDCKLYEPPSGMANRQLALFDDLRNPRAALTAEYAEFFSFDANDLTQTAFGISRDGAETGFPTEYLQNGILPDNLFATLDEHVVGHRMQIAVDLARATRPDLGISICGEHGGDPRSIDLCRASVWTWGDRRAGTIRLKGRCARALTGRSDKVRDRMPPRCGF